MSLRLFLKKQIHFLVTLVTSDYYRMRFSYSYVRFALYLSHRILIHCLLVTTVNFRLNCVMAYGSDGEIAEQVISSSGINDFDSDRSDEEKVGSVQEKAGLVMTYALGMCSRLEFRNAKCCCAEGRGLRGSARSEEETK